jgi:transposase
MSEKRKTYDKEFKLSAVKLVLERNKPAVEVAKDLGININSLHNWKRKYLEDQEHSFPGHGKLKPADEELRKLKRELETTKMERDILKKAIAFFAKEED